jgi:hypothetical protein
MAAKVVWYRDAWWVRTHAQGKKRDRKIGPTKADKRKAEKIAEKVNASLALGTYRSARHREKHLPCRQALLSWHQAYAPTFKSSFEVESKRIIDAHLIPFFGAKDLMEIRETDLLNYIGTKLEANLARISHEGEAHRPTVPANGLLLKDKS